MPALCLFPGTEEPPVPWLGVIPHQLWTGTCPSLSWGFGRHQRGHQAPGALRTAHISPGSIQGYICDGPGSVTQNLDHFCTPLVPWEEPPGREEEEELRKHSWLCLLSQGSRGSSCRDTLLSPPTDTALQTPRFQPSLQLLLTQSLRLI